MQCFFCAKLSCLSPRTHFAVIFDFPFGIASKEAAAMVLPRSLARSMNAISRANYMMHQECYWSLIPKITMKLPGEFLNENP